MLISFEIKCCQKLVAGARYKERMHIACFSQQENCNIFRTKYFYMTAFDYNRILNIFGKPGITKVRKSKI